MLNKQEVIDILEKMITQENKVKVDEVITKINLMSSDEFKNLLQQKNINSIEDVQKFAKGLFQRTESSEFVSLNDLISYGYNGNTIHIHVVPKDARFLLSKNGLQNAELKLIDALEKLQEVIQNSEEFKNIKQIYAVSGILKKPVSSLFENLDFDVKVLSIEDAKKDTELSRFYEIFKDKKDLGRAKLQKEKLLSKEWNKLKDERKQILVSKNLIKEAVGKTEMCINSSMVIEQEKNLESIQKEQEYVKNN